MFDDPKKELRRLEEELRALSPEEDFPEEDSEFEEEADFGPGCNPAVDFGRMCYDDEESVEDHALLKQKKGRRSRKTAKLAPARKETKKKKKRKMRPLGGQLLLAIVEIGLIIVIVRWWLQWMA